MIDRFHHLLIAPADFDQSLAFYRDTLGWEVMDTWGGAGERGAQLSGGGVSIVLTEKAATQPDKPMLHLDIHDIDARFKRLPPGTHVLKPPQETPWGTRWFVVRDPDGNQIAFEEVHARGR